MKKVILALDIQAGLNTPEVIVSNVNKLATKVPTIATVLVSTPDEKRDLEWLDWTAPAEDASRIQTNYSFKHSGYGIPAIVIKTLLKNGVEEVLVTGAHTEAFLLAAGFDLFDAGFKASMVAPLCLSGQYHQHTVTMKIWESSIGPVYETISEAGISDA
ncbi:MAG: nicotinamidase-related amidase [Alphaproteobacteria bacterium]|jgi:nicotinamidase-related amidase